MGTISGMSSYLKFCQSRNGSGYGSRNGSWYGFRFWNQDQETFLGTIELVSKIVNPEMVPDPDPGNFCSKVKFRTLCILRINILAKTIPKNQFPKI